MTTETFWLPYLTGDAQAELWYRQPSFGIEDHFPNHRQLIDALIDKLKQIKIAVRDDGASSVTVQSINQEQAEIVAMNAEIEKALASNVALRLAALEARKAAMDQVNHKLNKVLDHARTFKCGDRLPCIIDAIKDLQTKIDNQLRVQGEASNSAHFRDELNANTTTFILHILALKNFVQRHSSWLSRKKYMQKLEWRYDRLIAVPQRLITAHAAQELGTAHLRTIGGGQISNRAANRYNIV